MLFDVFLNKANKNEELHIHTTELREGDIWTLWFDPFPDPSQDVSFSLLYIFLLFSQPCSCQVLQNQYKEKFKKKNPFVEIYY